MALYTAGCYLIKFVVIKRAMLLVHATSLQTNSGLIFVQKKQTAVRNDKLYLTPNIKLLFVLYLSLLSLIVAVVMANMGGECEYASPSSCECTLAYDFYVICLAVLLITVDSSALLLFFVQWYQTMNAISSVITKSIFIQIICIIIALLSCCLDGALQLVLNNMHEWQAFVSNYGRSLMVQLDITFVMIAVIMSLSRPQRFVLRALGITRFDAYYQELDR
eukprot:CAMPEP_0197031362 /NCGR_PEP_ID=MMETSP1384-20130603/10390_1 /TAXON_ID=29189 /ORGANISM="Ammonia sp." /LENGTH=219 /DNA_ID=CAMNT_0042460879 /DNA_START=187 /DNA_END=842 /DNA_ORIENTATION=+